MQPIYLYVTLGIIMAGSLFGQPELIWSDEMEGAGLPDAEKWFYDVGGDGWGNNESQFYTDGRLENARLENGVLIIEARKEPWPSARNPKNEYTSARLLSKGRGDLLYGRVEVRAKLPAGRGTWPAIWMLPTGNAYGGWPRSGEIDIMEHVGYDMGTVHGSLHSLAHNWITETQPTESAFVENVDTEFHVYAIEWSPAGIRFLIDDAELMNAPNPETGWEEWPFDQPFYLILNLAVGGFWGGQQGIDPDIWPQRMEIDYVRMYDLGDTVPLDTDGDGVPNATDPDDDGDGLPDAEEHLLGTNLIKKDTDGDGFDDNVEIAEGTSPLLSGSYPGRDPSILMINPGLQEGEDPWIVHTNKLNESGEWIGQAGSWGGAYTVYDFVDTNLDGTTTFHSYTADDAPGAEHLLYQEWSGRVLGLAAGDTLRFRGTAGSTLSSEGMTALAFIRVLDGSFQKLPETVEIEIGDVASDFSLVTTIGDAAVNVIQVGVSLAGPQTESGSVTFSGLEAVWNADFPWGGFPVLGGIADTGGWMGWLNVEQDPWIYSYSLSQWMYMPREGMAASGGWAYIFRQ